VTELGKLRFERQPMHKGPQAACSFDVKQGLVVLEEESSSGSEEDEYEDGSDKRGGLMRISLPIRYFR
jgi:hypothetical protein